MSKDRMKLIGRTVGLVLVTLFAGAVMWATGLRRVDRSTQTAPVSANSSIAVAAPVAINVLEAEQLEILDTYAGMIQPFERFRVGFEVAGRVDRLGHSVDQLPLDEGHRVRSGQVLATLDQRILAARVTETAARLEQAQQELERARRMREVPKPAISETDYQTRVTDLAVAQAQSITAQKNLEDATLKSPCNGVISLRLVNAGESIGMHDPAFEIVEIDRVLLVVGVPESRVQNLVRRRRELQARSATGQTPLPFRVHVRLMGQDRFGKPRPPRLGEVYRIGETADDKTGLFEVEVLLDNSSGELKPGLVAQAKIVTDELLAFRVPIDAVLFRGSLPYFYSVREVDSDLHTLFWDLGPQTDYIAKQVTLDQYIEQEGLLIVPTISDDDRRIVVRGQHRLVDGRRVRIVDGSSSTARNVNSANSSTQR